MGKYTTCFRGPEDGNLVAGRRYGSLQSIYFIGENKVGGAGPLLARVRDEKEEEEMTHLLS